MKIKRIAASVCVVMLLCLGLYFWYRHKILNQVNNYQPMRIMVDGILYVHGAA